MILRPALRFLTRPFPLVALVARFLAPVILPPLLFFAMFSSVSLPVACDIGRESTLALRTLLEHYANSWGKNQSRSSPRVRTSATRRWRSSGGQLLGSEGVSQGEHGALVGVLGQLAGGDSAAALGGTVGALERGMRGLERLELAKEAVVLRMRDLGGIDSLL